MSFPTVETEGMQTKVWRTLYADKYFVSGENWPGGPKAYSINRLSPLDVRGYIVVDFRVCASREAAIARIEKLLALNLL